MRDRTQKFTWTALLAIVLQLGMQGLQSLDAEAFAEEAVATRPATVPDGVNRGAASPRAPGPGQVRPNGDGSGSLTGLFNRGWLGSFAAGLLGSGILGLLFGRGLFGGLGGAASYLGFAVQLALLAVLFRLIWTRWRHTKSNVAAISIRQLADNYSRSRNRRHVRH